MRRPRRFGQWTLRSRLVLVIVAIAGAGLLAANLVAVAVLGDYLDDRLDRDITAAARAAAVRPFFPPMGGADQGHFGREGADRLPADAFGGVIISRYNPAGRLLFSGSGLSADTEVVPFDEVTAHADGEIFMVTSGGVTYRVKVQRDARSGDYGVAAASTERVAATADKLLLIGLGVSGFVLAGIGVAAWAVVRIGLRPLTRMELAAASIAAADPPTPSLVGGRVPGADPHTEPGRLGMALNTMLARIEMALAAREASEHKLRQFLADASHELRTPLTSIRGFAELYRRSEEPAPEQISEMMWRIEQEAARMGLLVDDLLLLAALDEERPLREQQVDLLAVAADTVRDAHVRNPRRSIALTSFDPVTVIGDDHRLRQVMTNLVSNALRHGGEQAEVEVRVLERLVSDGDPPVVVSVGSPLVPGTPVAVIEVSDTGPGVPAPVAALIFERLYRVDRGRARSQGGSGLGLSIVAAIVGAHGGRVELATAPGQGATFRVLLPATRPGLAELP